MGISASLEIKKGTYLSLADGRNDSKAIATFILGPLSTYCDLQFDNHQLKDFEKENYEWFSIITPRMREDLCLLWKITYGYWDYSEDEYERYFKYEKQVYERSINFVVPSWLADRPGIEEAAQAARKSKFEVLSEEEFIKKCREIEQKWAEIDLVQRTIDDLIRVIEEIHPPETWWYNQEDSLIDFRLFSQALFQAYENGYRRVRIYYS